MMTEKHIGQCGRVTLDLKACIDLMYHILTRSLVLSLLLLFREINRGAEKIYTLYSTNCFH